MIPNNNNMKFSHGKLGHNTKKNKNASDLNYLKWESSYQCGDNYKKMKHFKRLNFITQLADMLYRTYPHKYVLLKMVFKLFQDPGVIVS